MEGIVAHTHHLGESGSAPAANSHQGRSANPKEGLTIKISSHGYSSRRIPLISLTNTISPNNACIPALAGSTIAGVNNQSRSSMKRMITAIPADMGNERGRKAKVFWRSTALLCVVLASVGCGGAENESAANGPVSDSKELSDSSAAAMREPADKADELPADGEASSKVSAAVASITPEDAAWTGARVNIIARHSSQCLDIAGGSTANFTKVVQWWCYFWANNQKFRILRHWSGYYMLVAEHSKKCLDLEYNSPDSGARIIQYDCHGDESNLFSFEDRGNGYYAIKPKRTGMCLDVWANLPFPGTGVIQWPCHYDWNQQFRFEKSWF